MQHGLRCRERWPADRVAERGIVELIVGRRGAAAFIAALVLPTACATVRSVQRPESPVPADKGAVPNWSACPVAEPAYAAAGYGDRRRAAVTIGRSTLELVRANDEASVLARLAPPARQAMQGPLRQLFPQAVRAVGRCLGETVVLLGRSRAIYSVDQDTDIGPFTWTLAIDEAGQLTGLVFRQATQVEADAPGSPTQEGVGLPFAGTWYVFWGGDTVRQNYHRVAKDQRYAYDFLIWRDGASYRTDGKAARDYWAWEEPVLSPRKDRWCHPLMA